MKISKVTVNRIDDYRNEDASKTMDDYINESYQLSKPDIDEWVETQSYLGKEISI